MTDDIGIVFFRIYPSVPHDLMCKESIFFDAHRVRYSTSAIVFFTTVVCVGIRENDFGPSGTDSATCPWTLTPIIIPTADHCYRQHVLIVIVVCCRLVTM